MSKQKIRKVVVLLASVMVAVSCVIVLPACTQKSKISYSVSQDANNFNIRRRITVFNMRFDKVLLQMEGCFAIETDKDAGELDVICELPDGTYQKHFISMYDGMFIVGIETPDGQATYHYNVDPYWDMFQCKEVDRAPEWDGHTPDQAKEP